MNLDDNKLELYRYELSSSSEVMDLIHKVKNISCNNMLIHIISIIHNTVLVHKLKSELLKLFPHAEIVLLKTKDKTKTHLKIYTINELFLDESLNDKLIENLDEKLVDCDIKLEKSRMNLLKRYFTDNLTHLPNIYQLRKDLDDNEEAGILLRLIIFMDLLLVILL